MFIYYWISFHCYFWWWSFPSDSNCSPSWRLFPSLTDPLISRAFLIHWRWQWQISAKNFYPFWRGDSSYVHFFIQNVKKFFPLLCGTETKDLKQRILAQRGSVAIIANVYISYCGSYQAHPLYKILTCCGGCLVVWEYL